MTATPSECFALRSRGSGNLPIRYLNRGSSMNSWPMKPALSMLALLVVALAACTDRSPDDANMAPATTPPVIDQPAQDVPPATAPPGTQMPPTDNGGAMPAAGAITFKGFGPAKFGSDAEAVRQAWGGELDGLPQQSEACYYLSPPIEPGSGYAVAFMIENDKFVRIDVARVGISAPGGGEIGMSADKIASLYPDLEKRNHKYVEGAHYLRITDPDGGDGVLVFETDVDGIVTDWRTGVPPQVDYVEGCS